MDRIYLNGHTEESLEKEDQEKEQYLAEWNVKFEKMVTEYNRLHKLQKKFIIAFLCGLPEILIWGFLLEKNIFILIAIILQMVISSILLYGSITEMESLNEFMINDI